jgi:hypothetical protein
MNKSAFCPPEWIRNHSVPPLGSTGKFLFADRQSGIHPARKASKRYPELYDEGILKKKVTTNNIPQKSQYLALPFLVISGLSDSMANVMMRIE